MTREQEQSSQDLDTGPRPVSGIDIFHALPAHSAEATGQGAFSNTSCFDLSRVLRSRSLSKHPTNPRRPFLHTVLPGAWLPGRPRDKAGFHSLVFPNHPFDYKEDTIGRGKAAFLPLYPKTG